ncbi:MAG: hypothetical protein FJ295_13890 [Planctomycetes bacterium]|nr:hypothetical protein [Planctomycetota bacterium]
MHRFNRRHAAWGLYVILAICGPSMAQERTLPVPPRAGDPELRNFPFGFVPKHLKVARRGDYVTGTQRNATVGEIDEGIARVGYQDETDSPIVADDTEQLPDQLWDDSETGLFYEDGCDDCGAAFCGPQWWCSAEYLLWWKRGMGTPALATITPNGGILPAATIVFGNEDLNDGSSSGGRFTIGRRFGFDPSFGVDFSYAFLGNDSTTFQGDALNFPLLARPFTNLNQAVLAPDARLINSAGVVRGTLDILASTEFQTYEILFRHTSYQSCMARWDWLIGYRDAQLRDRLRIVESTTALAAPNQGTTTSLVDQFHTTNTFRGVELGVMGQGIISPCWSWDWTARVGLGNVETRAAIEGRTVTTPAGGAAAAANGGLLAQASNSGLFTQDRFGTVTEFGLTLRRELPCGWSGSIGYSMVYMTNVWRAGEQTDTSINTSQIPPGVLNGAARPEFPGITSDFWAQGLRFGLSRDF